MKPIAEIIKELNQISFIEGSVDENSQHVKDAVAFYEKYPEYSGVPANGVFFILGSIRTKHKPVKVYRFDSGSV